MCDNILIHVIWNEDVLLAVLRSKTKTKILTVQPCFSCCYFKFRNKQDQNVLFSPVCSPGLQRIQPLVSRAAHSSCAHTSVPHRGWDLVQTGCSEEAFQGREAEPGEYNLHPLIPACTALPHASPSKWEQINLCKNYAKNTISVINSTQNVCKV